MELTVAKKEDMEAVFAIRFEVFVGEQHVPQELEMDAEDAHALHVLAREGDTAVGCGRVIFSAGEAHIGRLAVKKAYRGKGVGKAVLQFIIALCRRRDCSLLWLSAQLGAVGFYEKQGFSPVGEVFSDAGIDHIRMELRG